MFRKILAAGGGCAAALALAAAPLVTPAAASTVPGTNYRMYDSSCSFGGPCREQITIASNPSNVAIRAWINCYNAVPNTTTTVWSDWHTAVGFSMITGSCDGLGRSSNAGIQWNKTQQNNGQCWGRNGYPTSSWGPARCS